MVHGLWLDGEGGARYANRWVRSAGLEAERAAGDALFGGLSEFRLPPAEVMASVGPMKNTANTHVVGHAGRILALMEAGPPTELADDLSTIGEYDFGGALTGPMTAHPKIDPVTGRDGVLRLLAVPARTCGCTPPTPPAPSPGPPRSSCPDR